MRKKIVGSILMILGTCIGGGMLALPVVSSMQSYWMSLLLLVSSWLIMTLGALSLLEVNLWFQGNSNLITMSKATLGNWGRLVTWFIYLLLLYSLICAYLSGTSDVLQTLLSYIHLNIPRWLATVIAMLILVIIVHRGIGSVDVVNRGLMSIKLLAYIILVIAIAPHIHLMNTLQGNFQWHQSVFMVMITSFGYAIIIPSLRGYLGDDRKLLIRVVLIGSLLPLIIYAIWIFVVQGLLPRFGANGLVPMLSSNNTNSLLMEGIAALLTAPWMGIIAKLFISICAVTSFLGVSICLVDFVADGLQMTKQGRKGIWVYCISFVPPLLVVLAQPGIFIEALSYAGIWCTLLLIVLPLLMLYSGRHHKNLADDHLVPGGKLILVLALFVACVILIIQFK